MRRLADGRPMDSIGL